MRWGTDPALEKHYVPSRCKGTRSVLTFFAADAVSHALLYATATPDTLHRRFLSTGGHILNRRNQTIVRLDRRTVGARPTSPTPITISWLGGRTLR